MEAFGQFQSPVKLTTRTHTGTQWIGGWVCPRDGLDGLENKSVVSVGNRVYISSDVQPET